MSNGYQSLAQTRQEHEEALSPSRRIEAALRAPTRRPRTDVDLRKIRQGLNLTPQYVAALAGTTDMTLLYCEDHQNDPQMIEELLAVYALYMATRWGADLLHLDERNLREADL